MTFGGVDLYPTLADKAAALGFSLALNHGFVDGNKRIAHAAMETFLILNGYEIRASVDEQEGVFLRLAAGESNREDFTNWVKQQLVRLATGDSR
ncbi:MAG TPA: type II toxin-antitoxin system death-on-curing family toxin [Fimbriiglobus sp.]|jgi:death-on-curing protein